MSYSKAVETYPNLFIFIVQISKQCDLEIAKLNDGVKLAAMFVYICGM